MILNNEIEIPSWTNLFNRKVCTRGLKTKKEISDQISLITGIDGCLYFLKFENKISNYFFFFKTKNNDYFVKLIDNYQLNKIQSSLKLSSWLSKKGINTVNPCFPIKKVDTENIEPMLSVFNESMFMRKDDPKSNYTSEEILKNAPENSSGFFVVPKVIE